MAESVVLSLAAQSFIGMLGSYAGDKIKPAWTANEELEKLERSLYLICTFIRDVENKPSSSTSRSSTRQGNEGSKIWLMELKNDIYDIEDLLDEAATDALRLVLKKKEGSKKLYNKVRYHLSSSKHKFLSPFSLSDKVKDLRGRLDDVRTRNADEWKLLTDAFAYGGAEGSTILVTTRDEEVARTTIGTQQILNLELLSFHDCMSTFIENAFMEGENVRYPGLIEVGMIIVRRCRGLPLAVKALGSMLREERDEREWHRIAHSDLWKQEGVLAALRLSYNDLPCHLRSCFAYLSIYEKDTTIYTRDFVIMLDGLGLIKNKGNVDGENWMDTGERYIKELLSRSLLQEPYYVYDGELLSFKMHDLMHDLALDVMGEELATVTDSNDHPQVSRFVRHVSWSREHLSSEEEIPRELLLRARQVRTLVFAHKMTSINKKFIVDVISSFKCLRSLDLGSTDIEELPDSIGDLKLLRCLVLSHNVRLKSLPNSICKLLNLQTLDLLGYEQRQKPPEDVGKLINLTCLSLTALTPSKYLIPKRMIVTRSSSRHLTVYKCSELISLLEGEDSDDASDGFLGLTSLQELEIKGCPQLSWRCSENGWDNLPHISDIVFDGIRFSFEGNYAEDSE